MQHRLEFLFIACVLFFCLPNSVMAAAGDLDPTYGNNGKVTTDFSNSEVIRDAAVQPDGKIVVVGVHSPPPVEPIIARYKLDGSLDPDFGTNGVIFPVFDFGPNAVLIQPDGKIVAAGAKQGSFSLMRLNTDGSLDTTFGSGGFATIRFLRGNTPEDINDIALQPDGKIVAAGEIGFGEWFVLARFQSDGSPDTTFGDQGRVRPGMGTGFEQANAVVIQSDLKIVAAGEVFNGANQGDFALARFDPNGQLDSSFGNNGRVFVDFNNLRDSLNCLVLQPDGKLLAGGYTFQAFGTNDIRMHFGLAKFETDGDLDTSFGDHGKVKMGFFGDASVQDIVLQSDGKIVAAGSGLTKPASNGSDFILARYDLDGALDPTFGNLGIVITDFGNKDFATTVVLQPDNKLVAAGANFFDFALARYFIAPTNAPVLQMEGSSTHAVAMDSVTLVRDPFSVTNEHNFSADHQTRIILLATNLTIPNDQDSSVVLVQARSAGGAIHTLPVEYVGEVPGFEWLRQVVVSLPSQLAGAGALQVSITQGNKTSNQGSVVIN